MGDTSGRSDTLAHANRVIPDPPFPLDPPRREIAAAIEGFGRASERGRQAGRHNALRELMEIATSSLDVTQVFDQVGEQIKRITDHDGLCIAVKVPDEDRYQVLTLYPDLDVLRAPVVVGERVPLEEGTPGEVILTGRAVIRSDLPHDGTYAREQLIAKRLRFRSALHVPLRSRHSVFGVLILVSRHPNYYAERELAIVEEISRRISVIIEHTVYVRSGGKVDDVTRSFIAAVRDLACERNGTADLTDWHMAHLIVAELVTYLKHQAVEPTTQQMQGLTADRGEADLTGREREVLQLISNGLSNTRIADALTLSESTVKFHVSHIFAKLSVSRRTEAVWKGLERGLIAPP